LRKPVGRQIFDSAVAVQSAPSGRRQQGDISSPAEGGEARKQVRARSDKKVVWIELLDHESLSSGGILPRWLRELRYGEFQVLDNIVVVNCNYSSTADIVNQRFKVDLLRLWQGAECRLKLKKSVKDIRVCGLIEANSSDVAHEALKGQMLYKDRKNRDIDAPNFLNTMYRDELVSGAITLSDLRRRDESLWRALRNWAHNGKHNLDELIPRGRTKRGRPREELGFNPETLNPSDPVEAAALKLAQRRQAGRESAAKSYQRRSRHLHP
jgi:hypothetical protein